MKNQCLLALQCPQVSVVGGFRQWLAHGRAVMKGQHGSMIWVPIGCQKQTEPANGEETGEGGDTRFIIGTVFDISQTQEIECSNPTARVDVMALSQEAA